MSDSELTREELLDKVRDLEAELEGQQSKAALNARELDVACVEAASKAYYRIARGYGGVSGEQVEKTMDALLVLIENVARANH